MKPFPVISALALVLATVLPVAAADVPPDPMVDKLGYLQHRQSLRRVAAQDVANGSANIEFVMDDTGVYTIGTREGDPRLSTDNNKKLLFGHPFPWSSDTMIEIDGVRMLIETGTPSPIVTDGTASSIDLLMPNGIRVTETLAVVNSQGTSLPGAVRIHYRVTNLDGAPHDIRMRVQLDTMLADNDGAPFRLSDFDPVTHDREFDDHAATAGIPTIPSSALVFDDLDNPSIAAEFNFTPVGYPRPDRVVFGHWGASVSQWDYTVDPDRQLTDSSVIVWWGYDDSPAYDNLYTVAAGDSVEFALDYGIGNSCSYLPGAPFSLILCSPIELEGSIVGNTFRYSPDPAIVTLFLTNNGGDVSGARATLNLTPGLQLITGESATNPVEGATAGTLAAGESDQVDWSMLTTARVIGPRHFSVAVEGGGGGNVLSRAVVIKPIPNAVYGQATDPDGTPLAGATITVYRGANVVGTVTTQADGTYAVGGLEPGSYRVRLQSPGAADSWFTAQAAAPGDNAVTGNPTAFIDPADGFQVRAYPNPVRDGPVRIAFSTPDARSAEVRIFDASGRPVITIPVDAPGAGWHEVEWDARAVANGVYHFQVDAGGDVKTGRFAVLKRRL